MSVYPLYCNILDTTFQILFDTIYIRQWCDLLYLGPRELFIGIFILLFLYMKDWVILSIMTKVARWVGRVTFVFMQYMNVAYFPNRMSNT